MKRVIQILIALLIVVGGVGGAWALMAAKQTPPKQVPAKIGPLVRVITVQPRDIEVQVEGFGEVRAKAAVSIVPQVSGKVIAVHETFEAGGFVARGTPLLTIEPADYELALRQAEADLASAQAAVRSAEARMAEARARAKDVAEDLKYIQGLVKREATTNRELEKAKIAYEIATQSAHAAEAEKASAEARLTQASIAVEKAKLDLARTQIILPFDAIIVEENVATEQYVVLGQSLGKAYETSAVEIAVPLEDRKLAWLERLPIPAVSGHNTTAGRPTAEIRAEFAGREAKWTGHVVRTEAEIDRKSRMVHLIVEVPDPFSLERWSAPLMPGAFVNITFEGKTLDGVFTLPRHAVREDDTVWISEDNRLRIQPVQVVRRDRENAYITDGLVSGQQVIVSAIDTVVDGMLIRVEE